MRNISIIFVLFLLAACAAPVSQTSEVSETSEVYAPTPEATATSQPTVTATITPTASATPTLDVAEYVPDWKVAFETDEIVTEMGGAIIRTKIITAEDLDAKQIGKIDLNDGKVNPKWSRENSAAAVNEFTLKLLRHVWANNNPKADGIDANGYAEMIAGCADGKVGVEEIALPLKNVFVAEQPQDVSAAPFCGKGGEGIRQIDEVVYVFRNAAKVDGLTITDQASNSGNRLDIRKNTLYITLGIGTIGNKSIVATTGTWTKGMSALPSYMIGKMSFYANEDFQDILVDEWRSSCFRGALKVTDKFGKASPQEATCNP